MAVRLSAPLCLVLCALVGCSAPATEPPVDAGTDAVLDAACARDDYRCICGAEYYCLPQPTVDRVDDLMLSLGVSIALSLPLAPDGALLHGDPMPAATARMRAEHGFSGPSVVTPASCAAYAWSGTTATVTLVGCTFVATGVPVNGTVTLAVVPEATSFRLTFAALVVGTSTFDGNLVLTVPGADLVATPPALDIDIACTVAEGRTTTLSAIGLTPVTPMYYPFAILGTATMRDTLTTTQVTIEGIDPVVTGLTWRGHCLPSFGRVTLATYALPTTIVFGAGAYESGRVGVHDGPNPAAPETVFAPCP